MTEADRPSHGVEHGLSPHVFPRSEVALAHGVYGLILTLATLGELMHLEVSSRVAVAWLLGAGAVLLLAHLFSDVLAHLASSDADPTWSELTSIGREDLAVTGGAVGTALIMGIAWLGDLDAQRALGVCVTLGVITVAALSFSALPRHRTAVRIAMSGVAAALGALIVFLENIF